MSGHLQPNIHIFCFLINFRSLIQRTIGPEVMDVFFKWVRKDFIYFMSIFTEKFTGNRHIFRMQDLDQMSNEMPSCCTCNRYFVDEGAKIECKHYRINLSKDRTFMRRLCQGIYNIRSE